LWDCQLAVARLIGTLKMNVEVNAAVKAAAEHHRIALPAEPALFRIA
jgi:hypothetical protein